MLELARFREEEFENVVIKLPNLIKTEKFNSTKSLIIAAIYRQPNADNLGVFLNELEKLLKHIDKRKNEIVLTGDLNLDLLKYSSHLPTATYLDITAQHGLTPNIVRPTRIKKQSATLIDHIFTKQNPDSVSGIINTEIAGNCGYIYRPFSYFHNSKIEDTKSQN